MSQQIRSISIFGSFLDGARFDLAEGLNYITCLRGIGKTTLLELVRYGLDLQPTDDGPRRQLLGMKDCNLA